MFQKIRDTCRRSQILLLYIHIRLIFSAWGVCVCVGGGGSSLHTTGLRSRDWEEFLLCLTASAQNWVGSARRLRLGCRCISWWWTQTFILINIKCWWRHWTLIFSLTCWIIHVQQSLVTNLLAEATPFWGLFSRLYDAIDHQNSSKAFLHSKIFRRFLLFSSLYVPKTWGWCWWANSLISVSFEHKNTTVSPLRFGEVLELHWFFWFGEVLELYFVLCILYPLPDLYRLYNSLYILCWRSLMESANSFGLDCMWMCVCDQL